MSKTDWLDEISQVVMAADDKTAALAELRRQLPAVSHASITALGNIIDGEPPDAKVLKRSGSLWAGLFRLAKQGDKPQADYLSQYRLLSTARLSLESSYQTKFFTYLYFFWLVMTMFTSLLTITQKTLPVFSEFYSDFGAMLPPLTQFIASGYFFLFAVVIFLLAVAFALVVPWWYRGYIKRLLPIPLFLRLFPFYLGVTRNYHRYLQMVYAEVYHRIGEQTPLLRAEKQLPKPVLKSYEKRLLNVAQAHGGFDERLRLQQQKCVDATLKHIRIADSFISGIILLVYALLVYLLVRGIYEPIFILGEAVG